MQSNEGVRYYVIKQWIHRKRGRKIDVESVQSEAYADLAGIMHEINNTAQSIHYDVKFRKQRVSRYSVVIEQYASKEEAAEGLEGESVSISYDYEEKQGMVERNCGESFGFFWENVNRYDYFGSESWED